MNNEASTTRTIIFTEFSNRKQSTIIARGMRLKKGVERPPLAGGTKPWAVILNEAVLLQAERGISRAAPHGCGSTEKRNDTR